jgi:ribonuclease BN (tRNA processing enzyme)
MTAFTMQFLGTGNAQSKPPINFNNNVLITVNGHRWLIDCGLLCPLAMYEAGISPLSIDAVFISHLHGDHIFGLEELFFTNFFSPNRRRMVSRGMPMIEP